MATGPKNAKSVQKTMRMPYDLVERIEEIAKRTHRSFANVVVDILYEAIDEYEREHGRIDSETDHESNAGAV